MRATTAATRWMVGLGATVLVLAMVPLALTQSSGSGEQCFSGDDHPDVRSRITWTTTSTGTTIRVTFSKNFVDNTYGVNAVGWGDHHHNFKDLVGSDHVVLALYNGAGQESMEPKIDYISQDKTAASGYRSLGVTGGDGGMNKGSASDVVSAETSLSKNFNTYGYVLTQDSPATNEHYDPNPTYPNWVFDVWYEITVKASAFGSSGFDHADMTFVHASPSKTGSNSEDVSQAPCPPPSSSSPPPSQTTSASPPPTETTTASPCPEGQMRDQNGNCAPPPCPAGQMRDDQGACGPPPCPEGQTMGDNGTCAPASCPEGQTMGDNGTCGPTCPSGTMTDHNGNCAPPCPNGDMPDDHGSCGPAGSTASVPVFPTAASLALACLGATGATFLVMRRGKGPQ